MSIILKAISALIISMVISGGAAGMVETDPQDAAQDFMNGIAGGNEQITAMYMDNRYVNFLENMKGSDAEVKRLNDALFSNLQYDITDTVEKENLAAVKMTVRTNDFSKVMNAYDKASYKYVMDNLYDEKITDKKQLGRKCLDIYVRQVEKAAQDKASCENEVIIPLEDDGYRGWRVILSDEIMETLLGGLELPE